LLVLSMASIVFPLPCYPMRFSAVIQPIQVCDDSGDNCSAIEFNEEALQSIWEQADLKLDILPIRKFNSSIYRTIDSIEEGNALLGYRPGLIALGPVGGTDESAPPTILNVCFAKSSFSPPGEIALSFEDGNGAWVISGLGSEIQTVALAHSLGHNFGLKHLEDRGNLMNEIYSKTNTSLYGWQVAIVHVSRFVKPTSKPLPK